MSCFALLLLQKVLNLASPKIPEIINSISKPSRAHIVEKLLLCPQAVDPMLPTKLLKPDRRDHHLAVILAGHSEVFENFSQADVFVLEVESLFDVARDSDEFFEFQGAITIQLPKI